MLNSLSDCRAFSKNHKFSQNVNFRKLIMFDILDGYILLLNLEINKRIAFPAPDNTHAIKCSLCHQAHLTVADGKVQLQVQF